MLHHADERRPSGARAARHLPPSLGYREAVAAPRVLGSRSLEVRRIRPGPLPPALIDRFGPFEDPIEVRSDRYFVDPPIPDVSVKIKDGVQLDLKVSLGSPGSLDVPGAEGPLEAWEKWTFPLGGTSPVQDAERWITVDKRRRRRAFEMREGGLAECREQEAFERGCTFELTEVAVAGQAWWTLGFEASGAAETLEPSLRISANLMLGGALPDRVELSADESMSYVHWLSTPQRDAGPEDPDRTEAGS
jgi:hypothetical protein